MAKQRSVKIERLEAPQNESGRQDVYAKPLSRLEAVKARILATSLSSTEKSTLVYQLTQIGREIERSMAGAYSEYDIPTVEPNYAGFIGKNPQIQRVLEISAMIAPTKLPVLILGETGTGKELIANIIYLNSKHEKMITVNCGALPATLIESELFGHVKGAFTGAVQNRKGKFELADGGTIFLDEIGDLAPDLQVKLLRILQFGEVQRIGSDQSIQVDVRLLAATNKDLVQAVKDGQFRDDLYFRLRACELRLPPLRKRRDEIPELLTYFLNHFAKQNNRTTPVLSKRLYLFLLEDYAFPGNIRELENICHLMVILAKNGRVDFNDLPPYIFLTDNNQLPFDKSEAIDIQEMRTQTEKKFLESLLEKHQGHVTKAAAESGFSRARFYQLLKKYGINPKEFRISSKK